MYKSFATAALGALFGIVKADQPIHCLRTQVEGIWEFEISEDNPQFDMYETESVCTHLLPNKLQIVTEDFKFDMPSKEKHRLLLDQDYKVHVVDEHDKPTGEEGTWTMIYDQAFYITLPSMKKQIFANFRYSVDPRIEQSDWHVLQTGTYEAFISNCKETMVGLYMTDNVSDHIQCTLGRQVKPLLDKKDQKGKENDTYAQDVLFAQVNADHVEEQTLADVETNSLVSPSGNYKTIPEDQRKKMADLINSQDHLTYWARSYTDDDKSQESDTMFAQVSAGKVFGEKTDEFQAVYKEATKYLKHSHEEIDLAELPLEFRWDDLDGYDFTAQVKDQGRCGSCYKLSTNTVLESRIKIQYGQDVRLSVQHRLDCDFMNEGCHGGWAFMDAIFLRNFYAVDEDCAPYTATRSPEGCGKFKDCQPRAKVSDVHYLGGHYGGMTEEMILKELRARGPMIMDFNADQRFQQYAGGVLTDTPIKTQAAHPIEKDQIFAQTDADSNISAAVQVSEQTQQDRGIQWYKLTHSVTVIGWGYDEKLDMKYWLVRNSYGPGWGEGGNFRMRRGENDFGCEGNNISLSPMLMDPATGQWV